VIEQPSAPPTSESAPAIAEEKPQPTPPKAITTVAKTSHTARRARAQPVEQPAPASDLDKRNELLADYQRVGRALLELRRQRGVEETTEVWQQFRELRIEPALASTRSRADAEASLRDLRAKIERQKGVALADACLNSPLADGCR
jgi:hypothetical protein